jgi:hypothetical protein
MAFPTNVSTGWTFPQWNQLSFENASCKAGTTWAAAVVSLMKANGSLANVPVVATADYLKSVVPSNWTRSPTRTDLMAWYLEVVSNETSIRRLPDRNQTWLWLIQHPLNTTYCGYDICPQLGWKGDSDVSGIGMIISYGLGMLTIVCCEGIADGRSRLTKPTCCFQLPLWRHFTSWS